MSRSLPPAPNLEHLKKQARDLRKRHSERDPEALHALRLLRQFEDLADHDIFSAQLSLNEAQLSIALDYGFESAHNNRWSRGQRI